MRRKSQRDQLVGSAILLNDTQGDAYKGVLWEVDDSGYKLIGTGADKVVFFPGDGGQSLEMRSVFVPADRVKFVTEGT